MTPIFRGGCCGCDTSCAVKAMGVNKPWPIGIQAFYPAWVDAADPFQWFRTMTIEYTETGLMVDNYGLSGNTDRDNFGSSQSITDGVNRFEYSLHVIVTVAWDNRNGKVTLTFGTLDATTDDPYWSTPGYPTDGAGQTVPALATPEDRVLQAFNSRFTYAENVETLTPGGYPYDVTSAWSRSASSFDFDFKLDAGFVATVTTARFAAIQTAMAVLLEDEYALADWRDDMAAMIAEIDFASMGDNTCSILSYEAVETILDDPGYNGYFDEGFIVFRHSGGSPTNYALIAGIIAGHDAPVIAVDGPHAFTFSGCSFSGWLVGVNYMRPDLGGWSIDSDFGISPSQEVQYFASRVFFSDDVHEIVNTITAPANTETEDSDTVTSPATVEGRSGLDFYPPGDELKAVRLYSV